MDDLEKTMRFIVEQQAQFSVDIQQIREVLSTHSGAIVTVVNLVGKLAEAQAAAQVRVSGLETKMLELAAAGKETEARLNAFIVFVEKYISSHDGDSQAS
jgi:hypothetical protein